MPIAAPVMPKRELKPLEDLAPDEDGMYTGIPNMQPQPIVQAPKPKIRTIKIIGKNGEQITVPMPDTDDPKEIKAQLQQFLKQHQANEAKQAQEFKSII